MPNFKQIWVFTTGSHKSPPPNREIQENPSSGTVPSSRLKMAKSSAWAVVASVLPSWTPNISGHYQKFSCPGDPAPGIFARMFMANREVILFSGRSRCCCLRTKQLPQQNQFHRPQRSIQPLINLSATHETKSLITALTEAGIRSQYWTKTWSSLPNLINDCVFLVFVIPKCFDIYRIHKCVSL